MSIVCWRKDSVGSCHSYSFTESQDDHAPRVCFLIFLATAGFLQQLENDGWLQLPDALSGFAKILGCPVGHEPVRSNGGRTLKPQLAMDEDAAVRLLFSDVGEGRSNVGLARRDEVEEREIAVVSTLAEDDWCIGLGSKIQHRERAFGDEGCGLRAG